MKFKGIIGVCGGSIINNDVYEIVEQLGTEIAHQNYLVVCGGLGGTMEAVCKGAKAGGGTTIGIIPGSTKEFANKYVDIIIPSGLGEGRNLLVVQTADGIITVSGGAGTLSEMAFAWRLKKPIVALSSTGGWSAKLATKQIDATRDDFILDAHTPKEAVTKLIQLVDTKKEKKKEIEIH